VTSPSGPPSGGERRPPSAASRFRLRFEKFASFVEAYGSHISLGGIFLETDDPRPVGSQVAFEVELSDGYRLLEGSGEVIWIRRRPRGPEAPAGMALRFQTLDEQGRELVLKMLEEQVKGGGEPFEPDRIPGDAETGMRKAADSEPAQAAIEFDAPWGDRLPEMPAEMLEEDADDDEPTIARPPARAGASDATAAAEQAVRELEATPDFELASEPGPELGELGEAEPAMPDFTAGDDDLFDLDAPGAEAGELPPEPSFELEEEDEAETSFASVSSELSEPRPMGGFEPESEDDAFDDFDDEEPTLVGRSAAAVPPAPPEQLDQGDEEDDEEPTLVSQRVPPSSPPPPSAPSPSPGTPAPPPPSPEPPAEEPPNLLTDIREARYPDSASPPAAGFSPLPVDQAPPAPTEPPRPAPSVPPTFDTEPGAEDGDPFVDLDPLAAEDLPPAPAPASPEPIPAVGQVEDYEHELEDAGDDTGDPRGGRRGISKGVWAALLLVGIVAAGYLLRDELLELVGLDGSSPPLPATAVSGPLEPSDAETRRPEPAGAEPAGETEPAEPAGRIADVTEPTGDRPAAPAADEPAGADPGPAASDAEPTPPPPAATARRRRPPEPTSDRGSTTSGTRPTGPPATRLADATWRSTAEGTVVALRFDGVVDAERVAHDPLGWTEDREQVVVGEISAPYRLGAIDVRTAEVARIRTGVHPSPAGGSELRLVFDLASPRAGIATVRCLGDRVEVLVRGR